MNKWSWLFIIMLCWLAAGFAISARLQNQNCDIFLPPPPQRIVSMAPNLTEILFALGLENEIVGVTLNCNYPPAATTKPKIGTFWYPNIETIIAAKPTLVITSGPEHNSYAQRLNRIGCNCLTMNVEKVPQLFDAINKISTATGRQNEADRLVLDIQKRLNNLAALVAAKNKPRVLWVVQREPLRVAGTDTFTTEMIELAGGQNAIGPTVYKYPPIGSEQVIAARADVIIEPSMTPQDLPAQQDATLKYWNEFENLPAVVNKRIYVIDGDTVSRLGPRVFEAVETIARCLHPELFEN